MSILENINKAIIDEYKSGNQERRVLLQTVKAEILAKSKDLKRDLNEEEEIGVLRKEAKIRQESMEQFKQGGREDLVEKARAEVEILSKFLPKEISPEEIDAVVESTISREDDKSFGNIMKKVMAELKGKADGAIVAAEVKKKLG